MLPLSTPLITCLLAASGQDPLHTYEGVRGYAQSLPAPPAAPLPMTRTVTGDLDGDRQIDVACLEGSRLHVMLAPGAYEAPIHDVASASDLAAVAVQGAAGDTGLVLATPAGPSLFTLVGVDPTPQLDPLSLPGWGAVERLRAYTSASGTWLVGIESDGRTVHCAQSSDLALAAGSSWSTHAPTTLSQDVQDLAILELDGQGSPEVGLVSSGGLRLFALPVVAGNSLATHPLPAASHARLARLGASDTPRQWLACIARSSAWASGQRLALFGQEGLLDSIPMGAVGYVAGLAAGDYDGDGRDDLLLSRTADWDLGLLLWQGSSAPAFALSDQVPAGQGFAPSERIPTGFPASASANQAWPALADLDGDGDLDCVCPIQTERKLWVGRETRVVNHEDWMPPVVMNPSTGVGALVDDDQNLMLDVALPTVLGSATHVEVSAWTQPAPYADILPLAFETNHTPLGSIAPGGSLSLNLAVPANALPPGQDGFEELVYLSLGLVRIDELSGDVLARYPVRLLGVECGNGASENADYLAMISAMAADGPKEPFVVFDVEAIDLGGPGEHGDDEDDGSGHELPCLPVGVNNPLRR